MLRALLPGLIVLAACTPKGDDTSSDCDFSVDPCQSGAAWTSTCDIYPTIQAALDAAGDGSTVHVCAGTHEESLLLYAADHPNQHINLDGEGSDSTTIKASPVALVLPPVDISAGMVIYDDGVELDIAGLTLTGGTGYEWYPGTDDSTSFGGALDFEYTRSQLSDVVITSNSATIGGAINAERCDLKLTNSAVTSNTGSFGGGVNMIDTTLQSVDTDWGHGDTDNVEYDVLVQEGSDRPSQYYDYAGVASFTCTTSECVDD